MIEDQVFVGINFPRGIRNHFKGGILWISHYLFSFIRTWRIIQTSVDFCIVLPLNKLYHAKMHQSVNVGNAKFHLRIPDQRLVESYKTALIIIRKIFFMAE